MMAREQDVAERPTDLAGAVAREPAPREIVQVEIEMRPVRPADDLVIVEEDATGHRLPEPRSRWRSNWLFVWTVLLPVMVAGVYLFLIAANRYQSEAKFIVRSSGGGGFALDGSTMGGASLSRAGEDAYIVDDYITSRDALDRLVKEKDLSGLFARPEADAFNRFPPFYGSASNERLYDYYRSMVKTWVDGSTGISTIEVTAFRPDDALLLTRTLLGYAESVVNRINDRANADRVTFAKDILDKARAGVVEAEKRLTDFRSTSGIIDPSKEYQAALQGLSRLSTEASQREAALNQPVALTPNAPGIASLREKVKSYRDEIARQTRDIAGGADSLAVKTAGFERLTLERDIASKELVNAEVNLDTSLKEAGQQRLYLQPVVAPNLPDVPDGPRRVTWFLVVAGASVMAYAALRHLKGIAEEHAA